MTIQLYKIPDNDSILRFIPEITSACTPLITFENERKM